MAIANNNNVLFALSVLLLMEEVAMNGVWIALFIFLNTNDHLRL